MNTEKQRGLCPSTTQQASPAPRALKHRSHGSLPIAYTQPALRLQQRRRLCSEPIQALQRQGIVQCDSVSMEEAWSRCGIRVPKLDGNGLGVPLPAACMSTRLDPSEPPRNPGGVPNAAVRTPIDIHHASAEKNAPPATCFQDRNMVLSPPVQCLQGKGSVAQSIKAALGAYRHSSRQRSGRAMPTNGTGIAVTRPLLPTPSTPGNLKRQRELPYSKSKMATLADPVLSQPLPIARSKGPKRLSTAIQLLLCNKVDLQSQLGRPTKCNDSPYSIANPAPLEMIRLRHAEVPSIQRPPSRLPLPRIVAGQMHRLPQAKPAQNQTHLAPSLAKIEVGVPQVRGKVCRTESPTTSSESESEYSCATFSECGDATISARSSSDESLVDEAKELWRSLESDLGVKLGCQRDGAIGRLSHVSRIPRLQRGTVPMSKLFPKPPPRNASARPSRLPVPSQSVTKHASLVRNCSLLTQTISTLRSAGCDIPKSRTDSTCSSVSTSYVGCLPPAERTRREAAMQRQNWGERSLRVRW